MFRNDHIKKEMFIDSLVEIVYVNTISILMTWMSNSYYLYHAKIIHIKTNLAKTKENVNQQMTMIPKRTFWCSVRRKDPLLLR
jgi:hypothetical protein